MLQSIKLFLQRPHLFLLSLPNLLQLRHFIGQLLSDTTNSLGFLHCNLLCLHLVFDLLKSRFEGINLGLECFNLSFGFFRELFSFFIFFVFFMFLIMILVFILVFFRFFLPLPCAFFPKFSAFFKLSKTTFNFFLTSLARLTACFAGRE